MKRNSSNSKQIKSSTDGSNSRESSCSKESSNSREDNSIDRSTCIAIIRRLADEYNNPRYFQRDPIAFPKHFLQLMQEGTTAQVGSAGQASTTAKVGSAGQASITALVGSAGQVCTTAQAGIPAGDGGSARLDGVAAEMGAAVAAGAPSGREEGRRSDDMYLYSLKDVEIAGLIAAHLAWGRRDMIVRDCNRAFDEMQWRPLEYVMRGEYRCGEESLHRTIKWSEFAAICGRMREFYAANESVESLTPDEIRVRIYGQASNPKMANKKIHMFRRWMVRNDGIVDLGLWKHTSPAELIIPLDTHVHASAIRLGITSRKSADIVTAQEITEVLKEAFPGDPCKGDFALFAYAAVQREEEEKAKAKGNEKP